MRKENLEFLCNLFPGSLVFSGSRGLEEESPWEQDCLLWGRWGLELSIKRILALNGFTETKKNSNQNI